MACAISAYCEEVILIDVCFDNLFSTINVLRSSCSGLQSNVYVCKAGSFEWSWQPCVVIVRYTVAMSIRKIPGGWKSRGVMVPNPRIFGWWGTEDQ